MPSLFFGDGGEPPLAQIKTKYNIVLCPPEIVHHLKYLRCFILLVEPLRVAVSSKFPPSALIIEFGLYIHLSNQQMTSVAVVDGNEVFRWLPESLVKFGPDVTVESDTVCASVCFKTLLHLVYLLPSSFQPFKSED